MNLPIPLGFSETSSRGSAGGESGARQHTRRGAGGSRPPPRRCWLAGPSFGEPPTPPDGLAVAAVESDRVVPEEEWAADLVELLALDAALPDAPRPEDYFSLLCAEQAEREVGTGGRSAPIGPLFEASAGVSSPRQPGEPVRIVLSVPATALYSLSVEGVGRQRWLIDQKPVGHLDPTPLGVVWSTATTPLRAGPHELTGYLGPDARAERVSLVALRSLCIAPADGWHARRPLTYGAKARTLVRVFGFEATAARGRRADRDRRRGLRIRLRGRRPHQSPRRRGGFPERLGDGVAEPRGAELPPAPRGSRRGDDRGADPGRAAAALVGRRALPRDRACRPAGARSSSGCRC